MKEITERLFAMQDTEYRDFNSRLIPTVEKARIIGVRTPALRAFSKEISGSDTALRFMSQLPHNYYEEDNLHAFLIERINDFDGCVDALNAFLPYIDNWATCDTLSPKVLKKHPDKLLLKIDGWLRSEHTYTVRFAIGMLMKYYLDDNFNCEFLIRVANVKSDEYYIKMMVAWYFATALAKQYESAVRFIEDGLLDVWTHNKAIQKSIESYRIEKSHKDYLKTLKRRV